jgi:hypothetical protein
VSGDRVTFVGEAMSTIVQGIAEVEAVIGQRPVVVVGIAVLCRLSNPYRATTDLDVVDRGRSATPHLQVLRAVSGAEPVEPAAARSDPSTMPSLATSRYMSNSGSPGAGHKPSNGSARRAVQTSSSITSIWSAPLSDASRRT